MIENNIETVAASDDRVTVIVNLQEIVTAPQNHEIRTNITAAAVEVGAWLQSKNIQFDFDLNIRNMSWVVLRLSNTDAEALKSRFPTVSNSEAEPYVQFDLPVARGANFAAGRSSVATVVAPGSTIGIPKKGTRH